MPRKNRIPSYRLHKPSGQAIVTLSDGLGGRRDVYLGPYGTPDSRTEYARVIAEWEVNGRVLSAAKQAGPAISINELILAFWPHVEKHYRRPDGTSTREVENFRPPLQALKKLYGNTPAREFGPLKLKTVRQEMMKQDVTCRVREIDPKTGKKKWKLKVLRSGLARGVINQRVNRIRRMFKWAVSEELVPPSVLHGLQTVRGLQRGRSEARETAPVSTISEDLILQTLPHVLLPVAAMIQLQLLTGMRSGEVCIMRACDLDTSGKIWLYRPGSDQGREGQHKTSHLGHGKVIALGPRAQEVVKPFLKLDTQAYLFSPREAIEALRTEQRKTRKTKVQPSQANRKKRKPKRQPGERYNPKSYAHAIRIACQKAGLPHWFPHQLRHTQATRIRREFGLDAARAVLGHRSTEVTEVYAEVDANKASEVMEKLG